MQRELRAPVSAQLSDGTVVAMVRDPRRTESARDPGPPRETVFVNQHGRSHWEFDPVVGPFEFGNPGRERLRRGVIVGVDDIDRRVVAEVVSAANHASILLGTGTAVAGSIDRFDSPQRRHGRIAAGGGTYCDEGIIRRRTAAVRPAQLPRFLAILLTRNTWSPERPSERFLLVPWDAVGRNSATPENGVVSRVA